MNNNIKDNIIGILAVIALILISAYGLTFFYDELVKLPSSLVALFMGIVGLLVGLHKHKENIELKKKEDLILKQQQLAMQVIDEVEDVHTIFAKIDAGSMELSEEDRVKYFKDIEIIDSEQELAMSKLSFYYNNKEEIQKIIQKPDLLDIYFSKDLTRKLYIINGISILIKTSLSQLISDDLYRLSYSDDDHKNSMLKQRNNILTKIEKSFVELETEVKNIKHNMKKYLVVETHTWDDISPEKINRWGFLEEMNTKNKKEIKKELENDK